MYITVPVQTANLPLKCTQKLDKNRQYAEVYTTNFNNKFHSTQIKKNAH